MRLAAHPRAAVPFRVGAGGGWHTGVSAHSPSPPLLFSRHCTFSALPPTPLHSHPHQPPSAPPSILSTCNYDSARSTFSLLRSRGLPVRHRRAVPPRNGSGATVMHCCLISSMKMSHPIVLLLMIAFPPYGHRGAILGQRPPWPLLSSCCYISLSCLMVKKKRTRQNSINLRAIKTSHVALIQCNKIVQCLTTEINQ